jgi:phage tail protein X
MTLSRLVNATARSRSFVAAGLALAALASLALAVGATLPARAQVMPPAGRMFGFVQVDDHGADDGTIVVAHVNGSVCGSAIYDANRGLYIIDLDSSNTDCDTVDAIVWFSVGACTSYVTGTVPEFSGAQSVDLVAPSTC